MSKVYYARFGTGNPGTYTGLSPTFLVFQQSNGTGVTKPSIAEVGSGTGIYGFTATPSFSISFIMDGATTGLLSGVRYVTGSLDPADEIDLRLSEQGSTLVAIGATALSTANSVFGLGSTLSAQSATLSALGTTAVSYGLLNFALGTTSVAYGSANFALGTTAVALGTTAVALGITNVAIGTTLSGLGTTIVVTVAGIGNAGSTIGGISSNPIDLFGFMKRAQEFWEGNAGFNKTSGAWSVYSRSSSILIATKTLTNSVSGITKS